MEDRILLLIGRSGSGKSAIANYLQNKYGFKQLISYTTRPMREDDKKNPSHIFVDKKEFDLLTNKVAYTRYNGYEYCATSFQVDKSDIYIIDPYGVEYFLYHYNGKKQPYIVYIDSPKEARFHRMFDRGDDMMGVMDRIDFDETIDFSTAMKYIDATFVNDENITLEDLAEQIYERFEL